MSDNPDEVRIRTIDNMLTEIGSAPEPGELFLQTNLAKTLQHMVDCEQGEFPKHPSDTLGCDPEQTTVRADGARGNARQTRFGGTTRHL